MPRNPRLTRKARGRMPQWMARKLGFLYRGAESHESFFVRIGEIFPPTDERYKLIERAYDMARREFRRHRRDSGERYFEHLRRTSLIVLVHLRVRKPNLIAAALLHDLLEDVKGRNREWLQRELSGNVQIPELVWWLTKPSGKRFPTTGDVDRKYHRNLREAPREALLIKLADRLDNLMTIWGQDADRVRDKIRETRDFLLPLAEEHQILIHELEDVLRLVEREYRLA